MDPRLSTLRRAADIVGFHLASLDMRQSSDVHERVLAELFAKAGAAPDYAGLDEEAKVAGLETPPLKHFLQTAARVMLH